MRYSRTDPKTKKDELWYFVDISVDPEHPEDAAKAKHVLRNSSGRTCHFPSSDFSGQFRLVTASTSSDTSDPYKETLANVRHNSTIRFAALPFFLTASAVLANSYKSDLWKGDTFVAWFGLGLAVIATVFEVALSRNLICWWKAIRPMSAADPWLAVKAHRSDWILWPVRYALFAPYLAAIYYWLTVQCQPPGVVWGSVGVAFIASLVVWLFFSKPAPYKAT